MKWLRYANLILFIVNIALFGLWWSLIRVDAVPPGKIAEYAISHVGVQITVLGVIIGVAALVLAGLGFIGFQAVLERAENTADKTARDVVARLASRGDLGDNGQRPRQSDVLPDPGPTKEAVD